MSPARLVCLDEPFTGVDAASLPDLMAYVRQRLRGRDTILVTHSPVEAECFDQGLPLRLG